jgi:RNA polymerase sigma-70 factor (ECF subfamily)
MRERSNEAWLRALSEEHSETKNQALGELRDYLLRSVLVYLSMHRSELLSWNRQEVYELAEDLAQDALINILRNLESFRGESKFTTWAYRFAINAAATELRRQRYRDLSLDHLLEEEGYLFASILAGQQSEPLDRQVEQRNYIDLLRKLIHEELTEHQRAAIIGIYLRGDSMDEVAAALQIKRNALYKLLYDARRRLKTMLEEQHLSPNDILASFDE